MDYPVIPFEGYWDNQITHRAQFTLIQLNQSALTSRSRSQLINSVRRSWSVSGLITNQGELDTFLRTRNGFPFSYVPNVDGPDEGNLNGNFTCTDWSFTWHIFLPPNTAVHTFQATFVEDFNPIP